MYLYVVTPGACGAVWDAAFRNKHFICLRGLTVLPRRAMGQLGGGGGWLRQSGVGRTGLDQGL